MSTNPIRTDYCLNCKQLRFIESRGLCKRCFRKREVRALYPCEHRKRNVNSATDDMTEEEIDVIVEEQYNNLPKNWEAMSQDDETQEGEESES